MLNVTGRSMALQKSELFPVHKIQLYCGELFRTFMPAKHIVPVG